MPNPIREKGLFADKNGRPLITTQQVFVADPAAITATTIAAAVPADAAAATATTIAAAIPAAAPAGGVGAAAGAWDTAANRDAAITTINDLRAYAVEQKADFDAAVADIADIRTKYNSLRAYGVEQKANFDKLHADVTSIRTQLLACLDVLEAHGLMKDA